MNIVNKKIKDLIHPNYNPRKISEDDFEQLKKSLTKFDVVEPAIVNMYKGRENIIVGGNQRIECAKDLGWDSFPCVIVNLTKEKEKELNIRLNKNTGVWDFTLLGKEFEIEDLINWGFQKEELIRDGFSNNVGADLDLSVAEFPITIIQNIEQYNRWEKIKTNLNLRNDMEAFAELLKKWSKKND